MQQKLSFIFCLLIFKIGFSSTVNYEVRMQNPNTHYFEITMNVNDFIKDSFDISMPTWAPGSYLIRDFSKNIESLTAFSGKSSIKTEQITKNTWRIYSKKSSGISIQYRVYAFEMSVRTSFLDDSHGYFNGTSIFMFIDELKNKPSTVSIYPYKDWKKVSTALKKIGSNPLKYEAKNYDELVDSPFEIGNHDTFSFEASGVKHHVAIYGIGNHDTLKLKTDMAKIVEAATDVFGENPNKEYTFIIHNLTVGSGGLEHSHSTTLQVNRWTYSEEDYKGFLSLVAHEYFHLWNVKRIKPLAFTSFDYNNENYTDLLWIMEGFTSYYDELLLYRAGFYSEDEILNKLIGSISSIENQPGNKVMSVTDASFNAWIKGYKPNENSYNSTISYYTKGSVIANMLDLKIIQATQGKKSLDNVFQLLYQNYYKKNNTGITSQNFVDALQTVSGMDFSDFYNTHIKGTKSIDYKSIFAYAGYDLTSIESKKVSLGVNIRDNVVKSVNRNSSAEFGGLSVNDEILAVNGFRFEGDMGSIISKMNVNDTLSLLISRDNIVKTISFPLLEATSLYFSINKNGKESNLISTKWLRKL